MNLLLRMYAECPDERRARRLLDDRIVPALGVDISVRDTTVRRYWKVREWFEITLMASVPDRAPFDALLGRGNGGWTRTRPDAPEAIWNPVAGAALLDPAVRWAHLEVWEDA